MSIKPILMNTEMVRAILDGRKAVTRRVVMSGNYTPTEIGRSKFYGFRDELNGKPGAWAGFYDDSDIFVGPDGKHHTDAIYAKLPYRPRDILYVRETWQFIPCIDCNRDSCKETPKTFEDTEMVGEGCFVYRADYPEPKRLVWRPSIHMPREAARIWLRVTDVRVERLHEMSVEDFKHEGVCECCSCCVHYHDLCGASVSQAADCKEDWSNPKFPAIWDSTIKPADRERYGWAANPWVWVIEFERCEKPEEGLNYEREKTRG